MRLRTHQQYRRVAQQAYKFSGHFILIDIRLASGPCSRLGITVTRRYGSAPQRNRFKRIVREAFRLSAPSFPLCFDLIIRPRSQALSAKSSMVQQELLYFIERATHLIASQKL